MWSPVWFWGSIDRKRKWSSRTVVVGKRRLWGWLQRNCESGYGGTTKQVTYCHGGGVGAYTGVAGKGSSTQEDPYAKTRTKFHKDPHGKMGYGAKQVGRTCREGIPQTERDPELYVTIGKIGFRGKEDNENVFVTKKEPIFTKDVGYGNVKALGDHRYQWDKHRTNRLANTGTTVEINRYIEECKTTGMLEGREMR